MLICLYLCQYLLLWDISYIVVNRLMSTFQCKFNHANLFSHSWDISRQSFYSYWWPDISVICCHFCILWSMPPGDNMNMGKGYNDMIGYATCSLSQCLMQKVLLPCFILAVSSCFHPHVCLVVDLWTSINSIDTFMYPYTLPILLFSYPSSSLCLSCNLSSSLRSLYCISHICVNSSHLGLSSTT